MNFIVNEVMYALIRVTAIELQFLLQELSPSNYMQHVIVEKLRKYNLPEQNF